MGVELDELFRRAAKCAIIDRAGTTTYRNDNKGSELFERRFPGVQEIVRVVEASKERELHGAAEAAVGTPAVLEFFLKVKGSLGVIGRRSKLERETVTNALSEPLRMALAELDLERAGEVGDSGAAGFPNGAHFLRLGGELKPCPIQDEELLADLRARLTASAAEVIVKQKGDYEKTYNSVRLVYAASEPVPMAAIFIPPWGQDGIVGNTAVAMPAGDQYRRVTFARRLHSTQGITFLDLYYVVDLWN
jgi:hypothetical protein